MRQALAPTVILLLIASVAGWLWFGGKGEAPMPSPDSDPTHESSSDGGDAATERTVVDVPPTEPDTGGAQTTEPGDPSTEQAQDETESADAPNVELIVRSSRTHSAIAVFRYAFRHRGPTVRGEGQDGTAVIALPPTGGELLVEATGHVPFTTTLTPPTPDSPSRRIDIFLDEAALATGIEITAVDFSNTPLTDVRVDAFRLPKNAGVGSWNRGKALWSRRTTAASGRYVLPELPAGDYGIRLLATDAAGEPLPLLPFARTFTLTGSNGFVERAVLEPGCVLGIELVDYAGQPLDPKRVSITLDLRLAGGPKVSRRWIQKNERGRFAANDAPPAAGTCWLDEAVTGGLYRLTVSIDGELRHDQQLALRQGERQHERIAVQ